MVYSCGLGIWEVETTGSGVQDQAYLCNKFETILELLEALYWKIQNKTIVGFT